MPIQHNEFSIDLPEGWMDRTAVQFLEQDPPADAALRHSVVIVRDPLSGEQNLEAYVSAQTELLSQSLPGFTLIARESLGEPGDQSVELIYAWNNPETGLRLVQLQRYWVREKTAFVLTGTALEGTRETYFPRFRGVAESVRFGG